MNKGIFIIITVFIVCVFPITSFSKGKNQNIQNKINYMENQSKKSYEKKVKYWNLYKKETDNDKKKLYKKCSTAWETLWRYQQDQLTKYRNERSIIQNRAITCKNLKEINKSCEKRVMALNKELSQYKIKIADLEDELMVLKRKTQTNSSISEQPKNVFSDTYRGNIRLIRELGVNMSFYYLFTDNGKKILICSFGDCPNIESKLSYASEKDVKVTISGKFADYRGDKKELSVLYKDLGALTIDIAGYSLSRERNNASLEIKGLSLGMDCKLARDVILKTSSAANPSAFCTNKGGKELVQISKFIAPPIPEGMYVKSFSVPRILFEFTGNFDEWVQSVVNHYDAIPSCIIERDIVGDKRCAYRDRENLFEVQIYEYIILVNNIEKAKFN